MIWLIDCWSMHKLEVFLSWMKKCILSFVYCSSQQIAHKSYNMLMSFFKGHWSVDWRKSLNNVVYNINSMLDRTFCCQDSSSSLNRHIMWTFIHVVLGVLKSCWILYNHDHKGLGKMWIIKGIWSWISKKNYGCKWEQCSFHYYWWYLWRHWWGRKTWLWWVIWKQCNFKTWWPNV